MKNILTTIPKNKYPSWEGCEQVLRRCDGETEWHLLGPQFWLINTNKLPKDIAVGESVCYMVYDGMIRGYLHIVDTDNSENYRWTHRLGKMRNTKCIVMVNWRPITPVPYTGFQGWRYTDLRP